MLPLQWYQGISKDLDEAKSGNGIVLHADENLIRVLTYDARKVYVDGYPSVERVNAVAANEDSIFEFNGQRYIEFPR